MLKDEFCTRRGLLCVILRGRFVFWVCEAGKAFVRIEKECTARATCGTLVFSASELQSAEPHRQRAVFYPCDFSTAYAKRLCSSGKMTCGLNPLASFGSIRA